ncbi:hypothetical protein ACFLTO_06040 [Chloroflexota bacterium]
MLSNKSQTLRIIDANFNRIAEVVVAGANSVSVISAVLGAESPEVTSRHLAEIFEVKK